MRTPKKIKQAIAKKFKNWKGTTAPKETAIQEPNTSSSKDFLEEPEKISENVLIVETAKEQQTPSPIVITEKDEAAYVPPIGDLDNTEIFISESSQKDTTQGPSTSDSPSSAKLCSGSSKGNSAEEKPSKRASQPIVAGIVGAVLLISSIASYILKMHIIAVVGGIVGLMCIGFSLYNLLKPNTKLEKVEDVEQPIIQSSLRMRFFR
ncbi:MAG: hypothetical protein LBH78_01415 [Rickettsiales bacterium]|jgi:hypothetical protein|nr:hypothetical protein [Rickettsiales bacterium]